MSSLAIRTTKSRPRATFTCSSMSLEVAQTTEASAPPKPSSLGEAAAASVAEVSPVPFSMLRRLAGIQPSFLASSTVELVQLYVSRSTQKLDIRLSVVSVSNAAKYGKSRNFLPDQLFPLKYGKKT